MSELGVKIVKIKGVKIKKALKGVEIRVGRNNFAKKIT